jgi:heme/copper-type cytochrome/quinol oxidase subunit 2
MIPIVLGVALVLFYLVIALSGTRDKDDKPVAHIIGSLSGLIAFAVISAALVLPLLFILSLMVGLS